jgi:arsenate reductase
MAEAWLRQLGGTRFDVHSAGTAPKGINPLTIRALTDAGIDPGSPRSTSVDEFAGQSFDYVVTVCDSARQSCPVFPGGGERLHWSLDDPAAAEGSEEERLAVFRRVRDEIRGRVVSFVADTPRRSG